MFFYLNVVGGEVEIVEAEENEGASDKHADCEETAEISIVRFYIL